MKIYEIRRRYAVEAAFDLDTVFRYILAEDDSEVYDYIEENILGKPWPGLSGLTKTDILRNNGDWYVQIQRNVWDLLRNEGYEIRTRWLERGEATEERVRALRELGILRTN
ncbi:hypothetical protein KBC70_03870 [Candidatus Woesebacteria bacterium]|nr:hypothetical protein [Candidatus Woesebacteria bacterium]